MTHLRGGPHDGLDATAISHMCMNILVYNKDNKTCAFYMRSEAAARRDEDFMYKADPPPGMMGLFFIVGTKPAFDYEGDTNGRQSN